MLQCNNNLRLLFLSVLFVSCSSNKLLFKKIPEKEIVPEKKIESAVSNEVKSNLDNYHKAAVEIIKLSLRKGLKKDLGITGGAGLGRAGPGRLLKTQHLGRAGPGRL